MSWPGALRREDIEGSAHVRTREPPLPRTG